MLFSYESHHKIKPGHLVYETAHDGCVMKLGLMQISGVYSSLAFDFSALEEKKW